jgi:hypothetical protein
MLENMKPKIIIYLKKLIRDFQSEF